MSARTPASNRLTGAFYRGCSAAPRAQIAYEATRMDPRPPSVSTSQEVANGRLAQIDEIHLLVSFVATPSHVCPKHNTYASDMPSPSQARPTPLFLSQCLLGLAKLVKTPSLFFSPRGSDIASESDATTHTVCTVERGFGENARV